MQDREYLMQQGSKASCKHNNNIHYNNITTSRTAAILMLTINTHY